MLLIVGPLFPAKFAVEGANSMKDKPPAPPKGTGKHRYVFVLLEGANEKLGVPEERKHWGFETPGSGVREWAAREKLTVLGANFHYEKYHGQGKEDAKFEM